MEASKILSKSIKLILLGALLYSLFLKDHTQPPFYDLNSKSQTQISDEGDLLKNGIMQKIGYSLDYKAKFNYDQIYPAFFGLHWLFKDFKFKQYEKFTFLTKSKLTQLYV